MYDRVNVFRHDIVSSLQLDFPAPEDAGNAMLPDVVCSIP